MPRPRPRGARDSAGFAGNDMRRSVKLLGAAMLGGVLMAASVLGALAGHRAPYPESAPAPGVQPPASEAEAVDLDRCRTVTGPDAACASAWEARRRHFFDEPGSQGDAQ